MSIMEHFGLTREPFERDLAPESLYNFLQFDEALARLIYVCERRTMAIITGESGIGKSALLRLLAHKLDPDAYRFIYVDDSNLTPHNFYTTVLDSLGLPIPWPFTKLKSLFKEALLDLFESKGKTAVIAIDEAQTLQVSMLQEFRFILNFRMDSFSPLALILVGEPGLKAALHAFQMTAIWRRVDIGYHLTPMNLEQTKAYISHRMQVAGCSHPIFPDDVIRRIQEKSKGFPAFINSLCRGCLLDAAGRNQELIDAENLNRVLTDWS